MSDTTTKVKLPTPEEITKTLQHHLDKLVPIISAVEVELATKRDIPVEHIVQLYKQQRDMEGAIR